MYGCTDAEKGEESAGIAYVVTYMWDCDWLYQRGCTIRLISSESVNERNVHWDAVETCPVRIAIEV